jgi:hypothetical protein
LLFGFPGGPESTDEWVRVGGKSDILRVALICVFRGRLAYEAELEASKPSYDGAVTLAVMGITVQGDGMGKAN